MVCLSLSSIDKSKTRELQKTFQRKGRVMTVG
jgi:hypothetical protein